MPHGIRHQVFLMGNRKFSHNVRVSQSVAFSLCRLISKHCPLFLVQSAFIEVFLLPFHSPLLSVVSAYAVFSQHRFCTVSLSDTFEFKKTSTVSLSGEVFFVSLLNTIPLKNQTRKLHHFFLLKTCTLLLVCVCF